ncbi:hypothetical protein [Nocardia rhamnosiphila]
MPDPTRGADLAAVRGTDPIDPFAGEAVNNNREIGRAMIAVAAAGADSHVLRPGEITAQATP